MKWGFAGVLFVLAAACAGASSADPDQETPQTPPSSIVQQDLPAAGAQPTGETASAVRMVCFGEGYRQVATQGGGIICHSRPGLTLALDGKPIAVTGADGLAIVGLRRDQKSPAIVSIVDGKSAPAPAEYRGYSASIDILPRHDTISTLSMECNKIAAQTPEEKRHAEVSWVKKDKALKLFNDAVAPVQIAKPAEGRYSSPFGATRTYVPKTKDCEGSTNVHNGQDIAIPTGTEIRAPMAGTVILADPDLYYEGGAVFLDMGRGLVSITMHMSRVDVKSGDTVGQGQLLGLSGATGRVTGPHLHWAIKFRNVLSDDRGTDIWLDPVLMLALDSRPPEPVVIAPEEAPKVETFVPPSEVVYSQGH